MSADGARVVSGGHDGKVKVWDAVTGEELLNIKGHAATVTSVAFSRDGKYLATASKDKTVKRWYAPTGKQVWSRKRDAKDEADDFTSVAFSPDGQRLAWADDGGAIKVWDIKNDKELFARTEHSSGITRVAFSPVDEYLASAGQDGRVILWDAQGNPVLSLKGHVGGVMSVSFSSDGKRLASASKDGTVKLWDARTGQVIKTFLGHGDLVTSVAFSPGGRHLVSASLDKTVRLWDASTAKESRVFKGQHTQPVESVAFSADGKRIFSRDRSDKFVAWSVETGLMLPGINAPEPGAVSSPKSPDGKTLALPVSNWFYLVGLDVSAEESAYRENMSRLKPWWHRERATHIEKFKDKQWYAAAFHWGWVVHADPADKEAGVKLDAALKNLSKVEEERLQRQARPTLNRE
jgi:WD40 repeat protein